MLGVSQRGIWPDGTPAGHALPPLTRSDGYPGPTDAIQMSKAGTGVASLELCQTH
jgi:hypothetical protein